MGEIVNLRRARKQRDRQAADQKAAENRAAFGRARAEKETTKANLELDARRLDGVRRSPDDESKA